MTSGCGPHLLNASPRSLDMMMVFSGPTNAGFRPVPAGISLAATCTTYKRDWARHESVVVGAASNVPTDLDIGRQCGEGGHRSVDGRYTSLMQDHSVVPWKIEKFVPPALGDVSALVDALDTSCNIRVSIQCWAHWFTAPQRHSLYLGGLTGRSEPRAYLDR